VNANTSQSTDAAGLVAAARSSILCSAEVQSSLCRAFDGLQAIQYPPVWNVLIDLCYFKIAKEKKKTPAEYLAASSSSSSGHETVSKSTGTGGNLQGSTQIERTDATIKLNILNYTLCPLLSAMSQSVGNSLHTIVLPDSVLFRFFEKVKLKSCHFLYVYVYTFE